MLAVIEIGGKQYNVKPGTKFKTEKVDLAEGKSFTVEKVLLISAEDGADFKIGMPLLKDEKVEAKVLSHGKADKIRVFKMKAKKRYSKAQGHRQTYTELEIISIGGKKAPAKVEKVVSEKVKTEDKSKSVTKEKKVGTVKKEKENTETKTAKKAPAKKAIVVKKANATKK